MARFFQQFFYHRGGRADQPRAQSPWGTVLQGGARTLLTCGLCLIAVGVLVLAFPLVLAFFVAAACFLAAVICLSFAWRIYRSARVARHSTGRIHVDVIEHNGEDRHH